MGSNNLPRKFLAQIDSLQKRTGYVFSRPELLRLAFTQRSTAGAQNPRDNNERLEFLGDAALGLLVGRDLYGEYPDADEGFMTIERSKLVYGQNLSAWGYAAGFAGMLSVGEDVEVSDAMVEDAVEAVAGAFFLDGGLDAVRCLLQSFRDYPDQGAGFDARRHLERDCLHEGLGPLRCRTKKKNGSKNTLYESTYTLNGEVIGTGAAADYDEAMRAAARNAVMSLNAMESRISGGLKKGDAFFRRRRIRRVLRRLPSQPAAEMSEVSSADEKNAPAAVPAVSETDTVQKDKTKRAVKIMAQKAPEKEAPQRTQMTRAEISVPAAGRVENPKRTFHEWSVAAGFGQPVYAVRQYGSGFLSEIRLSGALVVIGRGSDAASAENNAAAMACQLTAEPFRAEVPERLTRRFNEAFAEVIKHRAPGSLAVKTAAAPECEGACRAKLSAGGRFLCEAVGIGSAQAELFARLKTVGDLRLWPELLQKLGLSARNGGGFRPGAALRGYSRAHGGRSADIFSVRLPGNGKMPLFRTALFIAGHMSAGMTAPNRRLTEIWLALSLLMRSTGAGTEQALPLKNEVPEHPEKPAEPAQKKPRKNLKKQLLDWLYRLGDAYTRQ